MLGLNNIEAEIAESARRRARRMKFVRDRLSRPDQMSAAVTAGEPVRFNTLSLPGWLKLAELAGVPHIPAREILAVPTQAYFDLLDEKPSDAMDLIRQVPDLLREGEMLRMEQVAPYAVKAARGRGRPLGNGLDEDGTFDLMDMRFMDTLMDLYEDQVRFLARPIIQTRDIPGAWGGEAGSYPEEYRVIVQGGRLIGITNYYPQTRMSPDTHAERMRDAVRIAADLIAFMREHDVAPFSPAFPEHPEGPSFTLDLITREDGALLFLEGGPAAMQAAHPCCFLDEETGRLRGEPPLHGAAFSATDPVLALADIGVDPSTLPHLLGLSQPGKEAWAEPEPDTPAP
jgi:hypothetical protein